MKRILTFLLILFSVAVNGQRIPQPVQLPIPNILQQTQVWCWAAVAQQIIQASRGPQQTPAQCALVAMANNVHPNVCCSGMGNPACIRTGSLQQIQYLIGQFGGRFSSIAPPTDPMTLYNTLASGKAIILQISSGAMSAHVVVLTGMSFVRDRYGNIQSLLHINDPLSFYNQPVPYQNLIGIWMSAIVVN